MFSQVRHQGLEPRTRGLRLVCRTATGALPAPIARVSVRTHARHGHLAGSRSTTRSTAPWPAPQDASRRVTGQPTANWQALRSNAVHCLHAPMPPTQVVVRPLLPEDSGTRSGPRWPATLESAELRALCARTFIRWTAYHERWRRWPFSLLILSRGRAERRLGAQARAWLLVKNPSQNILFGTALVTFDSCGAFRAARRTRPGSGSAVAAAWHFPGRRRCARCGRSSRSCFVT
jgi:hypothetical protein